MRGGLRPPPQAAPPWAGAPRPRRLTPPCGGPPPLPPPAHPLGPVQCPAPRRIGRAVILLPTAAGAGRWRALAAWERSGPLSRNGPEGRTSCPRNGKPGLSLPLLPFLRVRWAEAPPPPRSEQHSLPALTVRRVLALSLVPAWVLPPAGLAATGGPGSSGGRTGPRSSPGGGLPGSAPGPAVVAGRCWPLRRGAPLRPPPPGPARTGRPPRGPALSKHGASAGSASALGPSPPALPAPVSWLLPGGPFEPGGGVGGRPLSPGLFSGLLPRSSSTAARFTGALPLPSPLLSRGALPCAPPPRRPRWGLRGAQGWFGAGSVVVVALRLCTLRPGLAQGRR